MSQLPIPMSSAALATPPADGPGAAPRPVIAIDGRCLLESGDELACRFEDIGSIDMRVVGPRDLQSGGILICYLSEVGIIPARIICEANAGGWIIQPILKSSRKKSFAARIAWHAERAREKAEQRAAPRIVPLHRSVTVWLGERLSFRGTILNISTTGAAIVLSRACVPYVGATIRVGKRDASVVRLTAEGIAVHFATPIAACVFDERIIL